MLVRTVSLVLALSALAAIDAGGEDDAIAALFARQCAVCHGANGGGDGSASRYLWPRARDFALGGFQLVSTLNGVPTVDDLARTIRDGMPGSAMPPFEWLSDEEIRGLAEHVRALAIEGLAARIVRESQHRGEPLDPARARHKAELRLAPGAPVPDPLPHNAQDAELGRGLYLRDCAACHGVDGRGRRLADPWTDEEFPWARDFTVGLLQGGGSREAIHRRVLAGMPGAGMPPSRYESRRESAAVVDHVLRLIPKDAEERLVRRRQVLRSRAVSEVSLDPNAAVWEDAPETRVVLSPLRWHDGAVLEAWVRSIHDPETLAIRVRWNDVTRDDQPVAVNPPSGKHPAVVVDAVAVQLSDESRPPLFGMGAPDRPVNLWHWKATRDDVAGLFDLTGPLPHGATTGGRAVPDVPLYARAGGALAPQPDARQIHATGIPSEGGGAPGSSIPSRFLWRGDASPGWDVVLSRARATEHPAEVDLSGVPSIHLTLAIWDGASGDAGPKKSISVWHELRLE